MLEYLQKFNQLPQEIKQKISNQETVEIISRLEKKYNLDLIALIMKVAIKEVPIFEVESYLINELGLSKERAVTLEEELNQKIFVKIETYLDKEYKTRQSEPEKEEKFFPKTRDSSFFPKRKRTIKLNAGETSPNLSHLDKEDHTSSSSNSLVKTEKKDLSKESSSQDQERGSSSFFSPEEEQEIKDLTAKTKHLKTLTSKPEVSPEEKIERIVKDTDIKFSSEATEDRFKKILTTYLKGIRNELRTKQTLIKSHDKGGLNLDQATSDRIINIAQKYKQNDFLETSQKEETKDQEVQALGEKLDPEAEKKQDPSLEAENKEKEIKAKHAQEKPGLEKTKLQSQEEDKNVKIDQVKTGQEKDKNFDLASIPNRDIDYDLGAILKQKFKQQKEPAGQLSKEALPKKELKTDSEDKGSSKNDFQPKHKDTEKEINKTNQAEEKINLGATKPKVKRELYQGEENRKKIEDIKASPRLTNPINEIRYMDLTSFRRLGADATARVEKVKERIDSLAQKYFAEKIDGIKAWRQNPINGMYLQIGRDSIIYNKSVDDIIKEKLKENKDYLTKEEFDAIMELNNKLRLY